jgi:hypothetical protein
MEIKNISKKAAIAFKNTTVRYQNLSDTVKKIVDSEICGTFTRYSNQLAIHIGKDATNSAIDLLKDGIECEIIQPSSTDWQKGKMKMTISFEFIAESIEDASEEKIAGSTSGSPLDEIRQTVDQ